MGMLYFQGIDSLFLQKVSNHLQPLFLLLDFKRPDCVKTYCYGAAIKYIALFVSGHLKKNSDDFEGLVTTVLFNRKGFAGLKYRFGKSLAMEMLLERD